MARAQEARRSETFLQVNSNARITFHEELAVSENSAARKTDPGESVAHESRANFATAPGNAEIFVKTISMAVRGKGSRSRIAF